MKDGILVVNKPPEITSYGVVDLVKKWFRVRKVGHGGTLDPFAEGVLIILINKATKIADQFLGGNKVYRFVLRLDAETDTLDKTGSVVKKYEGPPIERGVFEEVLGRFRGEIEHKTPAYAAAKIKGERLYKLTRKGIDVERPVKTVTIFRLELEEYDWPRATVVMECSKGTYVRQIGADMAREAGCYGHIESLVRLQSGPFSLEDAWTLDEIKKAADDREIGRLLIPISDALEHLPSVMMEEPFLIDRLKNGYLDPSWEEDQKKKLVGIDGPVRIMDQHDDRLLALWWPFRKEKQKRRLRVLI